MNDEVREKPELLMPAGDFEKMRFAFAYGADAVYAGVPMFSLRARENSFTFEMLRSAVEYAHHLGKKIYLTLNIYPHNRKVEPFLRAFCESAELGADGYILADPGLAQEVLRLRPDSIVHVSTQANVVNWMTARFWRDLGARRIILSRELSIEEIAEIRSRVPGVELEAFVHGAICISYSGRCLISNYLNYRDANQGTCTQSCRWRYSLLEERPSLLEEEAELCSTSRRELDSGRRYFLREKERPSELFEIDEDEHGSYLMNSKDLCAIELLQALCQAGVVSFKVEGRSKGVYYIAVVASAYRNAIDDLAKGRTTNPERLKQLLTLSSRTLTTGFYLKPPQEHGINYEDGDSLPLSHRFAGQVREFDAGRGIAWVDLKNKVTVGETIEWIHPSGVREETIRRLWRADGCSAETASGGVRCGIETGLTHDPWTLVRQRFAAKPGPQV